MQNSILAQIIDLMVGALSGIGQGIGLALSNMATSIFMVVGDDGAQSLSVFGMLIIIFAGLSLAFGLTRWVLNFITSLGNRNS